MRIVAERQLVGAVVKVAILAHKGIIGLIKFLTQGIERAVFGLRVILRYKERAERVLHFEVSADFRQFPASYLHRVFLALVLVHLAVALEVLQVTLLVIGARLTVAFRLLVRFSVGAVDRLIDVMWQLAHSLSQFLGCVLPFLWQDIQNRVAIAITSEVFHT